MGIRAKVSGLTLLAAAAFLAAPSVRAENHQHDLYYQTAQQRYFELPQNARTFGMAGSSVDTSSDSSSIIGNPAGLGLMKDGELSGSYTHNVISGNEFPSGNEVYDRQNGGSVLFATPLMPQNDALPRWGNIGFGWSTSEGDWRKDDSNGQEDRRSTVTGTYSKALNEHTSLGYSLTYVDDRFNNNTLYHYPMNDGYRHTVGVQHILNDKTVIGTTLFFGHGEHALLTEPFTGATSRTREVGGSVGVSHKVAPGTLLAVSADYQHYSSDGDIANNYVQGVVFGGDENGNSYAGRVGLEQRVTDTIAVRGGYRYQGNPSYNYSRTELNGLNGSANYNAFTLGGGIKFPLGTHYVKSINLDYGVEYRAVGDDDWQHVVTLSAPFNLCRE